VQRPHDAVLERTRRTLLGVLLLATGLLAGAHYGRKSGVRPRPTS
jgi:hypothetical protein